MGAVMILGVAMIVCGLLALAGQAIWYRRPRKSSRRWAIVQAARGVRPQADGGLGMLR